MQTAILPDEELAQLAQFKCCKRQLWAGNGHPITNEEHSSGLWRSSSILKPVNHLIHAITAEVQQEMYESLFPCADTYQCSNNPLEVLKAMSDPGAISIHAAKQSHAEKKWIRLSMQASHVPKDKNHSACGPVVMESICLCSGNWNTNEISKHRKIPNVQQGSIECTCLWPHGIWYVYC